MKISISVQDLFKGEAVGGLEFGDWLTLNDEGKLKQRLSFISSRAGALHTTPWSPESGMPGNVWADAQLLQQTAARALIAAHDRDFLTAAGLALDAGRMMGQLNGLLATYDRLKVMVDYRQSMVDRAEKKRGHKGPLTVAIDEMARRIPSCSYADLLTEMNADAQGQECLLYDLREQGLVTVKFVSVTAEQITYDILNGTKGKTLKTSTLSNKLTEAKKAP